MSLANTTAAFTLSPRVVDQLTRILVLEGKPYWDSKILCADSGVGPGGFVGHRHASI